MQEVFVKVQWAKNEVVIDLTKAGKFMQILEQKGLKPTFTYIR